MKPNKSHKIINLNNYVRQGTMVIYLATTIMCIAGLILDIISLHKLSPHIISNNLIAAGIISVSVWLYLIKRIALPVSFAIIVYVLLLNIMMDIIIKPYGERHAYYFLRNSFFVIYLITIASLTIHKVNGIIISLLYSAYFIVTASIIDNAFLKESTLFQLVVFNAYTATIYYFVDTFEKSMHERTMSNNVILKQKDELKEAVATKDKFFSIIAHDLKNPLNNLVGFSELLYINESKYDEKKRKAFLSSIYESATRASNLLENLLIWSRMQTQGIKTNKENINLMSVLRECVDLAENMRDNKEIDLTIDMPENIHVYADRYMLTSVVNNLISNAIKFTQVLGKIEISAVKNENSTVTVCIADNGVGISTENLDKLFRIDQGYTSKGTNNETGTGLGLLLCKDFVEKNDGKIWVDSEINKGSSFYFTIPISKK